MQLSELADLIMGQSPPSSTYNEEGNGLPFYQGKTDFGFKHPRARVYCTKPQKIAEKNDILISVRAPVGPVNINFETSCIGRGLAAIRAKAVDYQFLYYNLLFQEDFIASLGSGSTFHAINKTQLSNVEIPEFTSDEQQKIAYILFTVQKAIELQNELIERTTELKKSMMHKLFTEGIRGERQKETEIGMVPESWEVNRVGNLSKLKSGGTPNRSTNEYWLNGSIPWVKTGEVNYNIITETEECITQDGLENSSAKVFPKGTLLMAMYGQGITRGKVAILGIDASTNQACVAFFPKDCILPFFLFYYFQYHYENIRNFGHGANQKNLSADIISSIIVAYPKAKNEQEEIINNIEIIDTKIVYHSIKKQKLEELFRTLLHQLMTAQVRVDGLDI